MVWDHDPARSGDYEQHLEDWTRFAERYEAFEGRVFLRATCFSPAFAAAYARNEAKRYGYDRAERTAHVSKAVEGASKELRFFVAVVTQDPNWNDLHQRDGSLRPRLLVGGDALAPKSVKRLNLDELADARAFFPYADSLTRGYWLVFERPVEPKTIRLRLAGPPARVDLAWELL